MNTEKITVAIAANFFKAARLIFNDYLHSKILLFASCDLIGILPGRGSVLRRLGEGWFI
jgi:hypothetical protein